jgi:hypothetical protein
MDLAISLPVMPERMRCLEYFVKMVLTLVLAQREKAMAGRTRIM